MNPGHIRPAHTYAGPAKLLRRVRRFEQDGSIVVYDEVTPARLRPGMRTRALNQTMPRFDFAMWAQHEADPRVSRLVDDELEVG